MRNNQPKPWGYLAIGASIAFFALGIAALYSVSNAPIGALIILVGFSILSLLTGGFLSVVKTLESRPPL